MPRITPPNRRETAIAWGLGLVGGAYAAAELCGSLATDAIAHGRETLRDVRQHPVGETAVTLALAQDRPDSPELTNVTRLPLEQQEEPPLQAA